MKRVVIRAAGLQTALASTLDDHFPALREGRSALKVHQELAQTKAISVVAAMGHRSFLESSLRPHRYQWLENALQDAGFASRTAETSIGLYLASGSYPSAETLAAQAGYLCSQKEGDDGFSRSFTLRFRDWIEGLATLSPELRRSILEGALLHHPETLGRWLRQKSGGVGPYQHINNLCVSSLQAAGEAFRALQRGQIQEALVVGVEELSLISALTFACLGAYSTSEDPQMACLPFDTARQGIVLGDAAGVMLLQAVDTVEAGQTEILGYATRNNLYHLTRSPQHGQVLLETMQTALEQAQVSGVDLLCAHGTGTASNDPSEAQAIRGLPIPVSAVQSLKGHLGHTLAASGLCNVLLANEQLRHQVGLPTANLQTPLPECKDLDMIREERRLEGRIGLVNAAGFGGFNASLVFRAGEV